MKYLERFNPDWSQDSIRHNAIPSPIAKSTYFYIQEIGHFKAHPSYFTERENLNSYLVIFTLSGTGKLLYKGKNYSLKKKSIIAN